MNRLLGKRQTSNFAPEDVIDSMPENVITNILDRLPVQDAVRTSILSSNWRYKWNMISKLVFDKNHIDHVTKSGKYFNGRIIISRILLRLKGVITKVELYRPAIQPVFDAEDLNHWVLFLSEKGIKEFALRNDHISPIQLPAHILSCLELKSLKLRNCYFPPTSNFCGFPNLLALDLNKVRLENCEKFITSCPLLETLIIDHLNPTSKVKLIENSKLENLNILHFSLVELDIPSSSSGVFQLASCLPKLKRLGLNLQNCKVLVKDTFKDRISSALQGLKVLTLSNLDLNSRVMVLFAFELIHGSPNLQTLRIMATRENRVSQPPLTSSEVNQNIMGSLKQLRIVQLECIKNSTIDLCLIKSLLAYCSLLEKMVIYYPITKPLPTATIFDYIKFAEKVLMLPRASTAATINLTSIPKIADS